MTKLSLRLSSLALVIIAGLSLGCARKPDDGTISSEIQSRFSQDSGLSTKQLTVQTSNGVVTLGGNVDNQAQRAAAARPAASVDGVRTVVNNLQVGVAAGTTPTGEAQPPASMPLSPAPARNAHSPGKKSKVRNSEDSRADNTAPASNGSTTRSMNQTSPTAVPDTTAAASPDMPPTPVADQTPPPPPSPHKLIIDQGTQFTVRLIDPIDSEKNQTGDTFHATLNAPLTSDGQEAVPAGTELTGHLVSVKSAGKFAGQSEVVLQLDSIASGGQTYSLQTDQYKKTGSSRGKSTAEKVGGGAVLGSIIGALAGGGKGAAIGGAAGAGVGGGVQAAGKSQQIKLPSETVLNFTLQAPITVVEAPSPDADRQKLSDSQ